MFSLRQGEKNAWNLFWKGKLCENQATARAKIICNSFMRLENGFNPKKNNRTEIHNLATVNCIIF